MNYKKEILKIYNYKKYVIPYREKGLSEHDSIVKGIEDMKNNERKYFEITKSLG